MSNTVMFTAVPSGIASHGPNGTVASLSVYVTPKIAAPNLTSVAAFVDWPSVVKGLDFWVKLVDDSPSTPLLHARLDPNPSFAAGRFDSALWRAIFGAPHAAPAAAKPWVPRTFGSTGVLSYSAPTVSHSVKSTYAALAASTSKAMVTRGGTDALSARVADVRAVSQNGVDVYRGVNAAKGQRDAKGRPIPSLSRATLATLQQSGKLPALTFAQESPEFARLAAYHNKDNLRQQQPPAGLTGPLPVPDFHEIIGHLADHPVMLRRLGLVIDLLVDLPQHTPGAAPGLVVVDGFAGVKVLLKSDVAPGLPAVSPWTYAAIHPHGSASEPAFRPFYGDVDSSPGYDAQPVDNPFIDSNGLVRLDDPLAAHVDDLDVDHAGVHFTNFSESTAAELDSLAKTTSGAVAKTVALPALRTTGLTLHQVNREQTLGLRFAKATEWSAGGATFVAEDLVRGYRVDVRTLTGGVPSAWSSLCQRRSVFTFQSGAPAVTIPATDGAIDEGYVKASGMSAPTTDTGDTHGVHESIFHWDGWSLVTARPGDVTRIPALKDSPAAGADAGTAGGPATPPPPFTVDIRPRAGSLPKLRFGTSYQLRVRAVDLCGNDMVAATPDTRAQHCSPVLPFRRYEPVSPPVLQLRRALTEGESLEHLVIRSDPFGPVPRNAAQWAQANNVLPPQAAAGAPVSMGMNPYAATCERHVAPPKTSVQFAEWHGAFDKAVAAVPAGPARAQAAWKIACKEDGTFYDRFVTDSTTGTHRKHDQLGRAIVTPPFSLPEVRARRATTPPTGFLGDEEITPRGTALVEGQYVVFDNDTVLLPYLPDPNAPGFVLQPDASAPANERQGLLAGPTYRTYGGRSPGSAPSWPELGVVRMVLRESTGGFAVAGLDAAPGVLDAAPTVTFSLPPAAVQSLTYSSTVADPTVHAFGPQTTSDPAFPSAVRGLLPLLSPQRSVKLVHAVQRPAPPVLDDGDVSLVERAEGDTAQTVNAMIRFDGASSGRVDFIASWDEVVDRPIGSAVAGSGALAPGSTDPSKHPTRHTGVLATLTPSPTDQSVYRALRQLFGDTKRRDITFSTVATTRFREYFPASITADAANITTTTALETALVCRSSARPPMPRVLYAVPSFRFTPGGSGTLSTSTRSGGTVRVYVDRGWFATGTDERLGVVLQGSNPATAAPAHLVSVWGNDPIWYRGALSRTLDASHVSRSGVVEIAYDVPLAEGVGHVDVATYRPNFNEARQLWYFDIELTTDRAYFPFLRLALVRYQPESIGQLHMSRVVLTDFVQLTAGRTASVVDAGGGSYTVSLTGLTAPNLQRPDTSSAASMASGHLVTAEFQEAQTQTPDDVDWTTLGEVATLAPSLPDASTPELVTYGATMTFPDWDAAAGAKHRILIKEYEIYATDSQKGVAQGVGLVQIGRDANVPYATRLVYADAIDING